MGVVPGGLFRERFLDLPEDCFGLPLVAVGLRGVPFCSAVDRLDLPGGLGIDQRPGPGQERRQLGGPGGPDAELGPDAQEQDRKVRVDSFEEMEAASACAFSNPLRFSIASPIWSIAFRIGAGSFRIACLMMSPI